MGDIVGEIYTVEIMPRQARNTTRYPGVYVVDLSSGDQTFFIRYKREGKLIEERAGRKKQGMTGAKANKIRADRMSGKLETNAQKRARLTSQAGRLRIHGLWKEYLKIKGRNLKGLVTDENRFKSRPDGVASNLHGDSGNKTTTEN